MKYLWLLVLLPAMALAQTNEQNLSQLGIRPSSGTPGNFALHWPASGLPFWIADTGTPGGTTGQLQYNNSGSFGGISNVSGGILIGQASGAPVFYATSGDCTISATGVVSCTKINGLTFPALVSGDCLTNNGTALSWGACGGGSGTVTSFAFTSGNGFTGTVTNSTTTPALSLAPSFTGLAYSNGSALGAATIGGGLSFSSGTIAASQAIDAQTGTTYTIASTDGTKVVTRTNATSCADTLPQAGSAGFTSGFAFTYKVLAGSSVACTLTPTTSTINGMASVVVQPNTEFSITVDGSGSNYIAIGTGVLTQVAALPSGTSVTPNCGASVNTVTITGAATINLPTGCTPYSGQKLLLIEQSAAADTLTWNAGYLTGSTTGAAPGTSTGSSKDDHIQLIYDGYLGTPGWAIDAYNLGL